MLLPSIISQWLKYSQVLKLRIFWGVILIHYSVIFFTQYMYLGQKNHQNVSLSHCMFSAG